jgi:hypothetical protein
MIFVFFFDVDEIGLGVVYFLCLKGDLKLENVSTYICHPSQLMFDAKVRS